MKDVDTMLRLKGMGLTEREKIVTVSFDEIYVKKDIAYDQNTDQFVGPHNRANVMLLRGLTKNYKVCHKYWVTYILDSFETANFLFQNSLLSLETLVPKFSEFKLQILKSDKYIHISKDCRFLFSCLL